jgi:hypothetical protein
VQLKLSESKRLDAQLPRHTDRHDRIGDFPAEPSPCAPDRKHLNSSIGDKIALFHRIVRGLMDVYPVR